jgi:hypothetical protein
MSSEMPVWLTTVLMWEAEALLAFAAIAFPVLMGGLVWALYTLAQDAWRRRQRQRQRNDVAWHAAMGRAGIGMQPSPKTAPRTETDA